MDYDSHFLAPTTSKLPRKSPSRQTMGASLAHELAAAVMSEPTDSRALADELGLEFDDDEEGDEASEGQVLVAEPGGDALRGMMDGDIYSTGHAIDTPSKPGRGSQLLNGHARTHSFGLDSDFESSPTKPPPPPAFALSVPNADPIETLKENVLFLDQFIVQLKNIDVDSTPAKSFHSSNSARPSLQPNTEPSVERLATDMIRHIDDARREREVQLRDLINYEREFRKIDSEPGGADRLGSLEPLENVSLTDKMPVQVAYPSRALDAVPEDEYDDNWEAQQRDPRDVFDDDGFDPMFALRSPRGSPFRKTTRMSLPPPPPNPSGPLTPSSTLPHLAHIRTVSQVLAASLSGLSEHVQVNGAAAAEAGRKLRALKNKITDLQGELASAEQSMERIEKSERGLDWEKTENTDSTDTGRRIDGRVVVQEISASFFAKLQLAEMRVQAMSQTVS
ncbi:hypothetical protein CTheo_2672 [Ceratobasidium theobromae]|uniref:Uncharacterized protein n=1 Tax=Ceratobasidium theobromae TaxID=1582974 RepID=A0A5N5QRZ8_9AGAM|nr:hypothetical protein CTheo_2672 [Ceratobasidium theobromae]